MLTPILPRKNKGNEKLRAPHVKNIIVVLRPYKATTAVLLLYDLKHASAPTKNDIEPAMTPPAGVAAITAGTAGATIGCDAAK